MRVLPIQGKWYVCALGLARTGKTQYSDDPLAGPFDTEAEAQAAAGAIEVEQPRYQTHTEVWQCPIPEPEIAPMLPGFGLADTQPLPLRS